MRSIYLALTNNTIDEIPPPILRRCIVIQTDPLTDNELMHAAERVKIGGDATGKEFSAIDRLRDREHESTEPFQSLIPEIDEDVRKKAIENGRRAHERWKSFALSHSEDPGARTVQTLISYVELVAMGYHLLWQKDMDDIPDERFQRMMEDGNAYRIELGTVGWERCWRAVTWTPSNTPSLTYLTRCDEITKIQ